MPTKLDTYPIAQCVGQSFKNIYVFFPFSLFHRSPPPHILFHLPNHFFLQAWRSGGCTLLRCCSLLQLRCYLLLQDQHKLTTPISMSIATQYITRIRPSTNVNNHRLSSKNTSAYPKPMLSLRWQESPFS